VKTSCIISNNDYVVYAKQSLVPEEMEATPHAAIQALIAARKEEIEGGTAYLTHPPCYVCAKALANAGIRKIVYKKEESIATLDKSLEILDKFGIEIKQNEDICL
jgi:dCMP deaminase